MKLTISKVNASLTLEKILARVAFLLLPQRPLGSIPSIPEIFSEEKIVNVAKVNQRHWLDESAQRLEKC